MAPSKVAIVGTAQSWKRTPWNDQSFLILSLNDAYQLTSQGFQRADEWYDPHPLDHFFHPPAGQGIYAHQVPPGYYVRPPDHLKWLGSQTIPVWLHPDYVTQHPEAAKWAHARAFPKDALVAEFGRYFTSTPQWMMAHALTRGYSDFSIYGIHLATEQEYVEQRPGFEFLIGRVLGKGKLSIVVKDGMRHYETPDGHVALPEESPVLQSNFQYAFDIRPSAYLEPLKWEVHKLQVKRDRTINALKTRPWWLPVARIDEPHADGTVTKRLASTSALQSELWHLDAALFDTQQELQRMARAGGL